MKIKTLLAAALFLVVGSVAMAQNNTTDARQDGFQGKVKSVDQKLYEARVAGDQMERGDMLEHLQTIYTSRGYRKSMAFLDVNEKGVVFRTRYKHDGFGLMTLEHIVDPQENVIGRTYYLYDKNNVLSETYVEDAERQVENRILYIYNGQGRLAQRSYNDPFNEIYKREVYSYDGRGNVVRTVVFDRTKKKIQEWRYEYDEHNQPVSQTLFDYTEAEPEQFATLFVYRYDEQGNWIQKTEYTLEGARTTPVFITERTIEYFE